MGVWRLFPEVWQYFQGYVRNVTEGIRACQGVQEKFSGVQKASTRVSRGFKRIDTGIPWFFRVFQVVSNIFKGGFGNGFLKVAGSFQGGSMIVQRVFKWYQRVRSRFRGIQKAFRLCRRGFWCSNRLDVVRQLI